METFVKNTGFPRLQRRSEHPARKFDFEHVASVIGIDGRSFTILVIVFSSEDFELWNLDLNVPVDYWQLPAWDRRIVDRKVSERFQQIVGYRAAELVGETR